MLQKCRFALERGCNKRVAAAAAHQLNTPIKRQDLENQSTNGLHFPQQQQSPPGLSSSSLVLVPEASNSISYLILLNSTLRRRLDCPSFQTLCHEAHSLSRLSRLKTNFRPFFIVCRFSFYAAASQMSCSSSWFIEIAVLVTGYFIWPYLKIIHCTLCRH